MTKLENALVTKLENALVTKLENALVTELQNSLVKIILKKKTNAASKVFDVYN